MTQNSVKLSIISPSWNTGAFAQSTIDSIQAQSFKDWEHIVIDNESTDESLAIFEKNPHLRLIVERDRSPDEAIRKGLAMAKGEYITFCAISDGYLNQDWYKTCISFLDAHARYSLVWGIDQIMQEDGTLQSIPYNHLFKEPPPGDIDFIYYWLDNFIMFHERNLVVRRNVIEKCFPAFEASMIGQESAFCTFFYNFNRLGYLPHFVPVLAAYGRIHSHAASQRQKESGELHKAISKYNQECLQFRKDLLKDKVTFNYRDGEGLVLSDFFDRQSYISGYQKKQFKKLILYILPPFIVHLLRILKREFTRFIAHLKGNR